MPSAKKTPAIVLLMSPFAGYERALLRGIARFAQLHGPWAFYLSGDHPAMPLPRVESLSGAPVELRRAPKGGSSRELPDLGRLGATGFIGRMQTPEIARAVLASGLPAIALDLSDEQLAAGAATARLPEIRPDSHRAGRLAAEHFLERGFRQFAFCGYAQRNWSRWREEGFRGRLEEAGFACLSYRTSAAKAAVSWPREQAALARWLQTLPKPIGVMACNDVRGRQVTETCSLGRIDVPDDVAVVGVDEDRLLCELSNPPLSSVALGAEQGGYQAAELLATMMAGRKWPHRTILVEPTWVVARRSTEVFAAEDRHVTAALRFIRDHGRQPIGVADVVRQATISRRALEIRFQRNMGRSIRREIERVRLAWTRQLLLETNLPAWKIAETAGFSSPSYLSKVFHREVGVSLAHYRREHRTP
jgi:LacI family transcriptional regulator